MSYCTLLRDREFMAETLAEYWYSLEEYRSERENYDGR